MSPGGCRSAGAGSQSSSSSDGPFAWRLELAGTQLVGFVSSGDVPSSQCLAEPAGLGRWPLPALMRSGVRAARLMGYAWTGRQAADSGLSARAGYKTAFGPPSCSSFAVTGTILPDRAVFRRWRSGFRCTCSSGCTRSTVLRACYAFQNNCRVSEDTTTGRLSGGAAYLERTCVSG